MSSLRRPALKCAVCQRTICITAAGLVRVHGPVNARCPGSQQAPLRSSDPGGWACGPADPADPAAVLSALSSDVSGVRDCPCGRPEMSCPGPMIRCCGPGREWFHLECTDVSKPPSPEVDTDWCCIQCQAHLRIPVRGLRHIPKGARIETATALAQTLERCVSVSGSPGDTDCTASVYLPAWRKLVTFSSRVLAAPPSFEDLPAMDRVEGGGPVVTRNLKKNSLTTIVKKQVASFCADVRVPDTPQRFIAGSSRAPTQSNLIPGTLDMKNLKRRIEVKISDGDVSGAVRILSSDLSMAPHTPETLSALNSRHPPAPPALSLPPSPNTSSEPTMVITPEEIIKAIRSFGPSSAAGPDHLKPQHLKELTTRKTGEAGTRLINALTAFINLLIAGAVPTIVQPLLYGANLIALRKPGGGIRPIAVGNTVRRLAAKVISARLGQVIGEYLRPTQLGYGTNGGCEAAVHATRAFLGNSSPLFPRVVVKIDYKNAFNSIRRDVFLNIIRDRFPEMYSFVWQCYTTKSTLFWGESTLQSETGVQQGDPLGPALFSIAIQSVVRSLGSRLNIWYLDDGTLGGEPHVVAKDLKTIIDTSPLLGLELNLGKCEIILGEMSLESANSAISELREVAPDLRLVQSNNATLLGAPLFVEGLPSALEKKTEALKRLTCNLSHLHAHDALYLLKNCIAIPKLLHLLRCSPTWKTANRLQAFDNVLRSSLESTCNIRLDHNAWLQATLPTSKGGLGIRRSFDLSLPTFLSSFHATQDLVASVLPSDEPNDNSLVFEATCLWEERSGGSISPQQDLKCQRTWDEALFVHAFDTILETTIDASSRARLLAVSTKESSAWLNVLPVPHLGTKLDNDSIRIATGLRLGADIVAEHKCICGQTVDPSGHHGLSCRRSGGRIPRHQAANETIHRALVTGGIPAILEPVGVSRDDAKRPDGMTLIPWEGGRPLLWDFTCSDTLATSNRALAANGPGAVADAAESLKRRKYTSLVPSYIFAPVCIESMGAWGASARDLIRKIGRRIQEATGEPRSTSFLIQRLAIDVQRGNATSVMATIPSSRNWTGISNLPLI